MPAPERRASSCRGPLVDRSAWNLRQSARAGWQAADRPVQGPGLRPGPRSSRCSAGFPPQLSAPAPRQHLWVWGHPPGSCADPCRDRWRRRFRGPRAGWRPLRRRPAAAPDGSAPAGPCPPRAVVRCVAAPAAPVPGICPRTPPADPSTGPGSCPVCSGPPPAPPRASRGGGGRRRASRASA